MGFRERDDDVSSSECYSKTSAITNWDFDDEQEQEQEHEVTAVRCAVETFGASAQLDAFALHCLPLAHTAERRVI